MFDMFIHAPVLLQEVISALDLRDGLKVVDGTLGCGGHARSLITLVMPHGMFLGIERDEVLYAQTSRALHEEFRRLSERIVCVHGTYADVCTHARDCCLDRIDRAIVDLGFSSWHLEASGRGFSFQKDEALDMRYDTHQSLTAAAVVNGTDKKNLTLILRNFGEERYAARIADAIIRARRRQRILTTGRLAAIVADAVPRRARGKNINPATRTFQALRICVNAELDHVDEFLARIPACMQTGGRVAAISFHSLEDRRVKRAFAALVKEKRARLITKKPIVPAAREIAQNPRSRSAKLRVIEFI
jgi:16S rRNA (cytosine1402-N4)-methyltransferase